VVYELSDVLNDLMEFSAAHLQIGGRLVFWLPLIRSPNNEPRIPQHPALRLISNSEQPFNQCISLHSSESGLILVGSRNLLTYVKLDSPKSLSMRSTEDPQNRPEFRDMVKLLSFLFFLIFSLQYFNKELRT